MLSQNLRFRVWDSEENHYIPENETVLTGTGALGILSENGITWIEDDRYQVEPSTLRNDTWGRPIFENDIVTFKHNNENIQGVIKIWSFGRSKNQFSVVFDTKHLVGSMSLNDVRIVSVIGTKHDENEVLL